MQQSLAYPPHAGVLPLNGLQVAVLDGKLQPCIPDSCQICPSNCTAGSATEAGHQLLAPLKRAGSRLPSWSHSGCLNDCAKCFCSGTHRLGVRCRGRALCREARCHHARLLWCAGMQTTRHSEPAYSSGELSMPTLCHTHCDCCKAVQRKHACMQHSEGAPLQHGRPMSLAGDSCLSRK